MNTKKSLANSTEPTFAFECFGLGNEIAMDSDGMAIIPYGNWPHSEGMQQFGRAEADEMVGYFKNTWNKLKRAITGLPVFKGHPDVPAFANQYPDKTEYGQIADMEARETGLAVKLVLGRAGAALVERGLKFISPHWRANLVGNLANGKPIYAPVFMESIGLTDKPNIPGKSLLNSASAGSHSNKSKTENPTMPDWLKKLLGLANEATEADATSAIAALQKRPEPTALANEQSARTAAEGKVTALEGDKSKLGADLKSAQTALANERKARIDDMVATAIRGGKITEAEKETWGKRLLANFEDESKALVNSKQAVKTAATATRTAAGDDGDADDSGPKIKGLVNAEMAKLGHLPMANRYNQAFSNVKKANPDLFKVVDPC